MRAVEEVVEDKADPRPPAPRRTRADLWALLSYGLLAVLVLSRLWRDPSGRVLASNDDDHGFFMFVMAHGERVLFHGDNPLLSDRLNVPDGVNMMANTTVLALSVPFAPITHWLGAGVTLVLLLTLGLAGTATAWYWVLSRHLVTSRFAAWIGGLWCGFCPALVSHANGHVNFVSLFVVPFIVWQVLRLREPGRAVRGGLILGLLIVVQVFINEEILLFTALTLGVFVIAYALMARDRVRHEARALLAGLGVAGLVSVVLLAYPLYFQFTGPGHYQGQPFEPDKYATDFASIFGFARQSLAGNAELTRTMSVSGTEDNVFFGPFGLALVVASAVVLWRRSVAARAATVAAVVLLIVSMGPHLKVFGHNTGLPLPFGLVSHVPIIDLVSVTRFAMVPATIAGVLLALATDRWREFTPRGRRLWQVGLVLALVPLAPKPLPVVDADPLPPFVAEGMWRQYVTSDDRTLVTVPLPEVTTGRAGMRWASLTHLDYRSPRGYFMGPINPPTDITGSWNAPRRFTADLLWRVREYGERPALSESDKARITEDLIFWRAAVVVLVPGSRNEGPLLDTLTAALGEPQSVGGVQLWDMRALQVPPAE
ncbi:DUF2029 domain-containing protein [Actinoplanes bogorensis]|uniref:DUF2029 domain-containing protein n=1 Tax=Paractinoplanes bogorensis TaxID=1610840 RepID=A0ABS5YQS5_9ACTN|nr:glycosyltransferase 87 family protein [Actinoplanes bogorensis]MBU2665801.1 DUF2029 domain-containing protein [Actinoplanes bogorensis]